MKLQMADLELPVQFWIIELTRATLASLQLLQCSLQRLLAWRSEVLID